VIGRIAPIGFAEDDGIKINLYGRSGTGKTTLWATFPAPILALVCSGGENPGELRSVDTPENRKRIRQVVIKSTDELREILKYQELERPYRTLVLDHATGLQDLVIMEHLGLSERPLALYKKAGQNESWSLVSRQGYGQIAIEMKELFRAMLNLKGNMVLVAQEREFNNDSEDSMVLPYVGSALTPSVTGWLNPACDYICQTYIRRRTTEKIVKVAGKKIKRQAIVKKKVDYCLRTAPDPTFTTKFRLPKGTELPECIVDPTYDKIMGLIKGGIQE